MLHCYIHVSVYVGNGIVAEIAVGSSSSNYLVCRHFTTLVLTWHQALACVVLTPPLCVFARYRQTASL
jgi:hypothetical protein